MPSTNVGSATGYLDLDISGFLAGLKTAQSEANSASKNIATQVGNNMTSVGKSLTSAGTTLTKNVTVPVVGLGTAIITTSANFESSMSKVQAISGATGGDLEALKAKAREMGATTKFSASEAAEAFQYMAMAGWDVDSMLGGISGVMNLAAASGEELGTVSDIVTDAMTAFGLSAKGTSTVLKDGLEVEVDNTTRFVDALAAASNSSNTNVAMLGESFKYVAPVAGALGYSVEDVAIALGMMANQGIKSSQAGTSLRTMLTNMANPTDTMAAAMDALGVSLENDDGSMKSLMEVMQDLRKGFGGGSMDAEEFASKMSELDTALQDGTMKQEDYEQAVNDLCVAMYGAEGAQKAQLAAMLAGKTGMAGLLAIVNTTEEDFNNLTDSIYNASGTSQEMADIMMNNLTGQLTTLKSQLEDVALQLGEILMPYVKKFVEWLQQLVQKFSELSPEQQEQIVKFAAIAAAIGPVLLVIGKLVTSVGGMITTFGKIPSALSAVKGTFTAIGTAIGGISAPVVAVVAAIGVLVAAFVNLWKTNEDFRNKITAIWDGIKSKFESFAQGIVDRLNALRFDFQNITDVLKAIWDGFCSLLAPVFEGVFNQISVILGSVLDVLTGIFDVFVGIFTGNWDQAWQGVKEIFGAVWDLIKGTFESWTIAFRGIADTILGWFGTSWDECWNSVKQFFVDTWNSISSFFVNMANSIKIGVSNFITSVINFFAQLPTNIANFITNAYNAVVTWVSNMVAKAREMGQNFLNAVVEFFTNLPYKVGYFIGNTLTNVVIWVANMVNKAKEMGTNFLNQVVAFFTQLPGKVLQFITSAFNNVQTWATNMANKAKEMAINFLNNVVSFFTQLPGKVLQFITSALTNVQTWATNMVNKAREMGTNFISNVVSFMQQLPGKIKQYLDSAINNLKTWVTQMGTKGKEAVQSLINNVTSAASGIADKVKSIGSDIVSGVWNGVVAAKDTFVNNVKSFFSGIVDGVKDALGIGSPSKVFRDEVGKWLPAGVAVGFEGAMPAAMKEIQSSLDDGMDGLSADANMDTIVDAETFAEQLKSMYTQLLLWFESVESRMHDSMNNMKADLAYLIRQGQLIVNSDGTLGYVGYGGYGNAPDRNRPVDNQTNSGYNNGDGDTFVFYSPKAIDEIEAARQMRNTKRDMAEGF